MGLAVGIDLGTTNSAIARVDEHGRPAIIPNRERSAVTPSVVCFAGGEILVGDAAKDMQDVGTAPVAAFFKRQMGDPQFVFHAHGVDYSATDLSSIVLRKLKADAEAHFRATVTHAVITVPAYFRDAERQATIAAGTSAGFEVMQVVNEPTAAAVAYGLARSASPARILVYDLGGGTFDVTLLDLAHDEIRVRSSDGDHRLGGRDWDDRIVQFLATRFQEEFGIDPLSDRGGLSDLLIQAELAKKKLTAVDATPLSLTCQGRRGRYTLDRATFEAITADLLERTASLTTHVLSDLRLEPADVDGVLLVGGSTRMPMVHRFVQKVFGRPPMTAVNVDEAVALGAAVVAAERAASIQQASTFSLRGAVKTIDVTNHSLGMIAVNADRSAYVNSVILPKNATIPCAETRPYQHRTRRRGENTIEVFMTQGEVETPTAVSYLGLYTVHDVPHAPSGVTVVEITYRYDASGTVQVSARAKGTSEALRVTVDPLPPDVPARFDGAPQAGVSEHVTAYLAFDVSGSMSGEPMNEAKKAARGFLEHTDLSHCSVGVMAFSDSVATKLHASQNARAIGRAIDALAVGETGGANGAQPFDDALALLESVKGRSVLVALTDGVWSDQATATSRARACHAAGIEVIAIGFGGADRDFLRSIASSDEDSIFTSLSGLVDAFSTIAQVLTQTGGLADDAKPAKPGGGLLAGIRGALRL
jgi:molecular chaperone DnaK